MSGKQKGSTVEEGDGSLTQSTATFFPRDVYSVYFKLLLVILENYT